MDETWLYHYDPETKHQSMEWRHTGSPRPATKNSECKNVLEKFSPRFFFGSRRHIQIDNLPMSQTINAEYYSSLLVKLKDILKEKRRGAERSPMWSCSCTTITRLTRHLQPRRNCLPWASNV
jgi:hypothetical protein